MDQTSTSMRVEDFTSVGTRVSWSAILAGTFVAVGMYFLLASLGAAVGLSISDHTSASTLQTSSIVWAFVISIAALFVGGLTTSVYTVGENKIEGVVSAIVTWALVFTLMLAFTSMGLRAGFTAMSNLAAARNTQNWEASARAAGVTDQQLAEWRRNPAVTAGPSPEEQQAALNAAKRVGWYVFAGTWVSMLAAAIGGYVGAGTAFRIVTVRRPVAATHLAPNEAGVAATSRI
jgi:uncharacterized membrane protein